MSHPQSENDRQQSVNKFGCCILNNPRAVIRHLPIIELLATFIGNIVCVDTATPQNERQRSVNRSSTDHQHSVNRLSTERQQFWVWITYIPSSLLWHIPIINVFAYFLNKSDRDMVSVPV
jgi:hypothetical protein